jgi:hypothetical protein
MTERHSKNISRPGCRCSDARWDSVRVTCNEARVPSGPIQLGQCTLNHCSALESFRSWLLAYAGSVERSYVRPLLELGLYEPFELGEAWD